MEVYGFIRFLSGCSSKLNRAILTITLLLCINYFEANERLPTKKDPKKDKSKQPVIKLPSLDSLLQTNKSLRFRKLKSHNKFKIISDYQFNKAMISSRFKRMKYLRTLSDEGDKEKDKKGAEEESGDKKEGDEVEGKEGKKEKSKNKDGDKPKGRNDPEEMNKMDFPKDEIHHYYFCIDNELDWEKETGFMDIKGKYTKKTEFEDKRSAELKMEIKSEYMGTITKFEEVKKTNEYFNQRKNTYNCDDDWLEKMVHGVDGKFYCCSPYADNCGEGILSVDEYKGLSEENKQKVVMDLMEQNPKRNNLNIDECRHGELLMTDAIENKEIKACCIPKWHEDEISDDSLKEDSKKKDEQMDKEKSKNESLHKKKKEEKSPHDKKLKDSGKGKGKDKKGDAGDKKKDDKAEGKKEEGGDDKKDKKESRKHHLKKFRK